MDQKLKLIDADCIAHWIYTKEEWEYFNAWNMKRKGRLNYIWQSLFTKKKYTSSMQLTRTSVQLGSELTYFTDAVTELRRIDIYDKGLINVMNIVYENVAKSRFAEISIPIPRGKLKEAISIQEILMHGISAL